MTASAKRAGKSINVVFPDGTKVTLKGRSGANVVLCQWNDISGWNVFSTHRSQQLAENAIFQNASRNLDWIVLNIEGER